MHDTRALSTEKESLTTIAIYIFLAPTGAQEMQIFVHLSVCLFGESLSRVHNLLASKFMMTSG